MEASAGGTDTLHRSNIIDAITPSFHLTNNEITQTPSNSASGVFTSQTSLESFLLQHSKSKQHMLRLKTVGYGIAERISITYVTAAKVIDLYGFYPPKEKLNMLLQDFKRMHPDAADCFITHMLTLVLSILACCLNSTLEYLQECTKEAAIGGLNAQVTAAIKALIFLLPMTGKKNKQRNHLIYLLRMWRNEQPRYRRRRRSFCIFSKCSRDQSRRALANGSNGQAK
nr:uncharacterized protein LOC124809958 isoform X1 [Hydra vulgaris]